MRQGLRGEAASEAAARAREKMALGLVEEEERRGRRRAGGVRVRRYANELTVA